MTQLVILTGAGISAESGLSTFRDEDGLWCKHRIEDVATPEAFMRNPALVHEFYNMRRAQLSDVSPNPAHIALAQLAAQWPYPFLLVTQNVDNLHSRALADITPADDFECIYMHGELSKVRCTECNRVIAWEQHTDQTTQCPRCHETGTVRPHIVWFGEMPLSMPDIYNHLQQCNLFIAIGTSGNVYPAAGFVQEAKAYNRAHTIEMNLEPAANESIFDEKIYGPASKTVPALVERLLKNPDAVS